MARVGYRVRSRSPGGAPGSDIGNMPGDGPVRLAQGSAQTRRMPAPDGFLPKIPPRPEAGPARRRPRPTRYRPYRPPLDPEDEPAPSPLKPDALGEPCMRPSRFIS